MVRALPLAAVLLAPALAGCLAPAALDPGSLGDGSVEGTLEVLRTAYDFGPLLVQDPVSGVAYPARMQGSVHYPAEGEGPFPLLLFMHGRHQTCDYHLLFGEGITPTNCLEPEPLATPVDSFRGYDYLARDLVARGYVVASASANDINDRDEPGVWACFPEARTGLGRLTGFALCEAGFTHLPTDHGTDERAQLLLATLDRFAALHRGEGDGPLAEALQGRVDLDRIGLMGHSRGGEGVTRAITMNAAREDGPRHSLKAVLALAPSDFARQAAPGVPFATLLPSCDGDVFNQMGAWIYDDARYAPEDPAAPKHQFFVRGANHNFYNTVWTRDDAVYQEESRDDPFCGSEEGEHGFGWGRLTPVEQQQNGILVMGAFFRHYVGGEEGLGPFLRGEAPFPGAACAPGEPACKGQVHTSYHPPAPRRLVLEDTLQASALQRNDLGGASTLSGFVLAQMCHPPRRCTASPNFAMAPQLELAWRGPARYALEVPAEHGDLRGFSAFSLRVGVGFHDGFNQPGAPVDFRVVLTDARGRAASVDASAFAAPALAPPPGETALYVIPSMARVPLEAFRGVDLGAVREVALVFDRTPSGLVTLTDLMFQA